MQKTHLGRSRRCSRSSRLRSHHRSVPAAARAEDASPRASYWQHPSWSALRFSVDEPHYYSYQYVTTNPHSNFTARAHGDLDCDGIFSNFQAYGEVNAEGGVTFGGVHRTAAIE